VGAGVVGGDLSGGHDVVVSVTVLGDLAGRDPVRRDGARPGDVVAHAGVRGWSAVGLALLTAERRAGGRGAGGDTGSLVRAHLRPDPPLSAGALAAVHGATAMLDLSDGLLRDAGRLARSSNVVLDLDDPGVAFADDMARLGGVADRLGASARLWVLTGGEDHGLLATFGPEATVPEPFRVVGRVLAPDHHRRAGDVVVEGEVPDVGAPGWDHFRA
jgi:thiamine-monophosphate kinase